MGILSVSAQVCFQKQISFLLLIISFTSSGSALVPSNSQMNQSDRAALISFKSQIKGDPLGALSSWKNSLHHCDWQGITCSHRHRERVTVLDLRTQELEGTLSPYIGNLTFLRRINLSENNFHGGIPQEIGRLFRMEYLFLSRNSFNGEIPRNISHCSDLRVINLSENKLAGSIFAEISSLPKLEALDLSGNNFMGNIPSSLGNLSSLARLLLMKNNLEGRIPYELCAIRSLSFFQVGSNALTGKVPSCLYNHSNIHFFSIGENQLEGSLPPNIGFTLPNLEKFSVFLNNFSGPIPSSLGNLSSLTVISLAQNNFKGTIPENLCSIRSLVSFSFGINDLTGKIPSCLYNQSNLESFGVGVNHLIGSLPPHFGLTLPNLKYIILTNNMFSGPIPVSLSNATRLEILSFGGNYLSGPIPRDLGRLQGLNYLEFSVNQLGTKFGNNLEFITSLTNCSNLEVLGFEQNFLSGRLPDSLSNLSTKLTTLWADSSQLYGNIPIGLQNLVNLEGLYLQDNHLTGSIPTVIGNLNKLQGVSLGGNRLTGKIPDSLSNLTRITTLSLGANHLTGNIPPSLGKCQSLLFLNLSHNNLIGPIPKQVIGLSSLATGLDLRENALTGSLPSQVHNLTKLVKLYVSGNKLSGHLPKSLGDCLSLEIIFLDNNFFEGEIPKSFSALKGLKYFDISRNNMSGKIPEYLELLPLLNLNLSFNHLEGRVPSTGVFGNASAVSVFGNRNLCGGIAELKMPPCIQKSKHTPFPNKVIITLIVGSLCFLVLLCFVLMCCRRRVLKRIPSSTTLFNRSYERVSYSELLKATDGFAAENLIGVGSYGSVFRGVLQQINKTVAVKVFKLQREGAGKSFLRECNALRNLRHRNLLKIVTSCSSVDFQGNAFRALVFEFMPNGSLDDWLHRRVEKEQVESRVLNIVQRLNIAIDVGSALEYLHHHCQPGVVHCDIKPSNVLLNDDMSACVADFGLAKIFSAIPYVSAESQSSSIAIKGSIGYVAPEYGIGSRVTTQGDVYSFGVLLLEMFSGKKPTDDIFLNGLSLHNYAEMALPNQVMGFADPMLLLLEKDKALNTERRTSWHAKFQECLVSIIRLGVACSVESPVERMTMSEVVAELHHIKDNHQGNRSNVGGELASNKPS